MNQTVKARIKWPLVCMACGAAVFWIPDVLLHAVFRHRLSPTFLTFILLFSTFVGVLILLRVRWFQQRPSMPLFMLLGVWMFAGLATTLNATFEGGGLVNPQAWWVVIVTLLPSLVTLTMSLYDKSFLALVIVTPSLILTSVIRKVWPGIVARVLGALIVVVTLCGVTYMLMFLFLPRHTWTPAEVQQAQMTQELNSIGLGIKFAMASHPLKAPPYLEGSSPTVSVTNLQNDIAKLGWEKIPESSSYLYCNLKPEVWAFLRERGPNEVPVAWCATPDPSGRRVVFMINLDTTQCGARALTEEDFQRLLQSMETTIRKATGDSSFALKTNQNLLEEEPEGHE